MDTSRSTYSREDVLRVLRLSPQQLHGWAKAGLIQARAHYSFHELSQIRKLCALRGQGIPTAAIRESVQAMKAVVGGTDIDASGAVSTSHGVAFRHQGAMLNPLNGQLELDFDRPQSAVSVVAVRPQPRTTNTRRAQELFALAVRAEEEMNPDRAIELYEKALSIDPDFVACHVNIGTMKFHARRFDQAEKMYRAAIAIDPEYALAHFNLGNTLDEVGRDSEAVTAYEASIRSNPAYADAHFNLALLHERHGRRREAIGCLRAYLRLDKTSEWARTAREKLRELLQKDSLKIVSRNPDWVASRLGEQKPQSGLRLVACHARRLDEQGEE